MSQISAVQDQDLVSPAQAKNLASRLANLLEYPDGSLATQAARAAESISPLHPKAGDLLEGFVEFAKRTDLTRMQEVYTHTFDLQVVCYPYVGYQMFGESYKRGQFLVKLLERYRLFGFDPQSRDLPDYLPLVLRFLGSLQDAKERQVLTQECLIPSVQKMIGSFEESPNVYADLLRALHLLLQEEIA